MTPRSFQAAGIPIYVHSPYLINVGSPNNRIRIPSRKILADTLAAAEAVGAAGVIVHGGHIGDDEDLAVGHERWRKALESVDLVVPVLLENTAGGGNAILRECDNYGPLWEAIGAFRVGVVVDTCHAWASGEDMATLIDRVRAATGRIDLVHCNDSAIHRGAAAIATPTSVQVKSPRTCLPRWCGVRGVRSWWKLPGRRQNTPPTSRG